MSAVMTETICRHTLRTKFIFAIEKGPVKPMAQDQSNSTANKNIELMEGNFQGHISCQQQHQNLTQTTTYCLKNKGQDSNDQMVFLEYKSTRLEVTYWLNNILLVEGTEENRKWCLISEHLLTCPSKRRCIVQQNTTL